MNVSIVKTFDDEYMVAHVCLQEDGKYFCHVNYKQYSPEAKKRTIEYMRSMGVPLHAYIHNEEHEKYLTSLGFKRTGQVLFIDHPLAVDKYYDEVVWDGE